MKKPDFWKIFWGSITGAAVFAGVFIIGFEVGSTMTNSAVNNCETSKKIEVNDVKTDLISISQELKDCKDKVEICVSQYSSAKTASAFKDEDWKKLTQFSSVTPNIVFTRNNVLLQSPIVVSLAKTENGRVEGSREYPKCFDDSIWIENNGDISISKPSIEVTIPKTYYFHQIPKTYSTDANEEYLHRIKADLSRQGSLSPKDKDHVTLRACKGKYGSEMPFNNSEEIPVRIRLYSDKY
jgi:hypothetical protein